VNPQDTIRFSHLFENELTLKNLPRNQLIGLCKYMNLYAIGTNSFLRYQLEKKINELLRDDKMIDAEGIESLTPSELHSACIARGMRTLGVPDWKLRQDLEGWLELHVHQKVPTTLLLLSRAFSIQEDVSPYVTSKALQATLSSLPEQLIEQTELHASAVAQKSDNELQLELTEKEETLIEGERDEQQRQHELNHRPEVSEPNLAKVGQFMS
jgi:LETM1 and EF-hand domain-containing protein 1, mitochondrial